MLAIFSYLEQPFVCRVATEEYFSGRRAGLGLGEHELTEVRKMELEGVGFIRRLEALRQHFKLNPPDPDDTEDQAGAASVIRTVCSDGIV